jgi:hypothetical protein
MLLYCTVRKHAYLRIVLQFDHLYDVGSYKLSSAAWPELFT